MNIRDHGVPPLRIMVKKYKERMRERERERKEKGISFSILWGLLLLLCSTLPDDGTIFFLSAIFFPHLWCEKKPAKEQGGELCDCAFDLVLL